MYFPLYTYHNESRYSAYLDFLVRSRGLNTEWRVTKSQFVQKVWLDRKTARTIWEKWAFICEYFRGKDSDTLYIAKKSSRIVCDVLESVHKNVKSLPDFKLFVTALQSAKNNDYGNRSRTLRTIWKETGTVYKQTVSKRVSRAKKLGLSVKHRFIKVGDRIAQISNSYSFRLVSFHYNRFLPTSIEIAEMRKARETKKNAIQLEIVWKIARMVDNSFYEDYSLFWGKMFTI